METPKSCFSLSLIFGVACYVAISTSTSIMTGPPGVRNFRRHLQLSNLNSGGTKNLLREIKGDFFLVGGRTNPFEKYARQLESFPQVGVKIENV